MRLTRIALTAVLPLAVLACSEEAPEVDEAEEQAEAQSEFSNDVPPPPPPPASWGEENFSDDNGASDPSFSDEEATSSEDLR